MSYECRDDCPIAIYFKSLSIVIEECGYFAYESVCLYPALQAYHAKRADSAWADAYNAFNEAVREFNEKCKEPGVETRFTVTWNHAKREEG